MLYPFTHSNRACESLACYWLDNANDYLGSINITVTGHACQRWDQQAPKIHAYDEDEYFPEKNVSLANNYCRNMDNSFRPWCISTSDEAWWEYCDVPKCDRRGEMLYAHQYTCQ